MHQRDTLYINGNWVAPSGQGKIEVNEASTEQVIGRIPEGDGASSRLDQSRSALFGDHKHSGNGREVVRYGLHELHKYTSHQFPPSRCASPG
ncbi:MAG TPA: hypothetical protein VF861_13405 [Telluria sp.]